MADLGTAYLRVLPDTNSLNARLGAYFSSSNFGKLGKTAGAALGAGLAAGGAAKALYEIGEAFDDVSDTIRVGTGATGKQLAKLEGSFKNVIKDVPADFDSAATAITELNRRLEVTGKPLERLAKQFTELSRITETDVTENVQTVTRAFGDWEIKTKDQAEQLDKFFRASQQSGAAVSELAAQVVQFGAPLRQVGFSLDQATAMFAAFEKAGVNTQTMMPGLRMALRSFLEAGRDPGRALTATFEGIEKGTIDSSKALEIFGARAGADMVEAIRQGRFELDELTRSLSKGDETIRKAGRQTMDFSEHWMKFKNNVLVALEPVATRVFETVGDAMKRITDIMSDPNLSSGEKFDKFVELITEAISKAVPKLLEAGKDAAVAVVKGFLDAGVWGAAALGGIIWKLLGGVKALSAASAAGSTVAQRFGAGFAAGLTRFGIAAAAVGVFQFGKELGDVLSGTSAAEKVGKAWGEDVIAAVSPVLEELDSRHAVGEIRRITASTEATIAKWEEAGVEIPDEMREVVLSGERMADRIAAQSDKVRESIRQMRKGFHDNLGEILRDTEQITDKITEKFGSSSAKSKNLLRDNYQAATRAIQRAMDNQLISVKDGTAAIDDLLKKQMKTYGIKNPDAMIAEIGRLQTQADIKRARGGITDVTGRGLGDSVPLWANGGVQAMVAPGEKLGVFNRHQQPLIDAAVRDKFGVAGLEGFFSKFNRPHFMARGGVVAMRSEAERIDDLAMSYVWGGSHGSTPTPRNGPFDCSSAVSHILQAGGYAIPTMVSGQLAQWGKAGTGPVTIYANDGHALMSIMGKFWGTSSSNPGGGPGWIPTPSSGYLSQFAARIPEGMRGAPMGGPIRLRLPRFMAKIRGAAGSAQGLNNTSAATERTMGRRISGMSAGMGDSNLDLLRGPGKTVGASVYGFGEAGTGTVGASGMSLPGVKAYAELDMGTALGGLPFGKRLRITAPGGRSAVGSKQDIGLGGGSVQGHHRAIDLWRDLAEPLGLGGDFLGLVKVRGFAEGGVAGPSLGPRKDRVRSPRRILERLNNILREIGKTDERIDIAQRVATFSTSPGGAELSGSEITRQIQLFENLRGRLTKARRIALEGMSLSKRLGSSPGAFRDVLTDVQGITGGGGRLLEVREALDQLRGTSAAGSTGLSIDQLLRIAEAARIGLFPRAPVMHAGGVVPGPIGSTQPILAQAGEEVVPIGARARGYELVITNWDEGKGFIRRQAGTERKQADRAIDLRARAGV